MPQANVDANVEDISQALSDLRQAMWRLGGLMRDVHQAALTEPSAAHLLIPLVTQWPGIRVGDLARHRGVSLSTVSRQVEQLVRDGWVRAEVDPADQRAHRLFLTEHGETGVRVAKDRMAECVLTRLGADRAARLPAAVAALTDVLELLSGNEMPATPAAADAPSR